MSETTHLTELPEPLDEFHKLELTQVVERLQSLDDLRVQIAVFFGTANLTAVGIAFAVGKAGVLFVAAAIALFFVSTDRRSRLAVAAYHYRGVQLHKRFAPQDNETFLQILPGRLVSQVREVAQLEDRDQRLAALRTHSTFSPSFRAFWQPCLLALLEAIMGLILWLVFSWPLF